MNGFVVTAFFRPLGLAILVGAMCGFYASALEKRIRMRPAPGAEPCTPPSSGSAKPPGNAAGTEERPSVS